MTPAYMNESPTRTIAWGEAVGRDAQLEPTGGRLRFDELGDQRSRRPLDVPGRHHHLREQHRFASDQLLEWLRRHRSFDERTDDGHHAVGPGYRCASARAPGGGMAERAMQLVR